ncbi:PAS domain-containing hybrid sensor histidine kinase/response regulator [Aliidiomarina maris]|uniref:histidine kinase n=1 Tax=Aliidiomarina maris TaxID=531312 RepID=A0A327X3B0_9GAMM|nr:PAS-domain containing protein [Aliidiomarina maris]RAK00702.1 Na+/proline symporter [Aliidiomarina maris]RUO27297.1 hybrid sensor histidine kinase/response regulator [Aliidiomarina maris]
MSWVLVTTGLAYIALLFAIAVWGDRRKSRGYRWSLHPSVYALSLAIYCTSWTYYGAIDNAAQSGWSFLPILLGPMLLYLFGLPVVRKMVAVSKQQNITSIADFIASRYGKQHRMALVVTLIAAASIVPYIALQLKAVGVSFSALVGPDDPTAAYSLKELAVALLMAAFAIMFGTRHIDVTQYRNGMMLAIAFESAVKLLALLTAAVVAFYLLRGSSDLSFSAQLQSLNLDDGWTWQGALTPVFMIQLFMAAGAILCLPRQFHVTVIDNVHLSHLNTARWVFPSYLLLTSLAIAMIAIAGDALLPAGVDGGTYSLLLPMSAGLDMLALFVFVGGISAATAMVVIATLTLSTMVSNDVIMPLVLKRDVTRMPQARRFYRKLLLVRRIAITSILLLGWVCYHFWLEQLNLVSMGLLAFSVVFQLVPAVLGGLYWRRGHAQGVYMGLAAGFVVLGLTVILPLVSGQALSVEDTEAVITYGALYSFLANLATYVVFSLLAVPSLIDRIQAMAYTRPRDTQLPAETKRAHQARGRDLKMLMQTFLGRERTEQLVADYGARYDLQLNAVADAHFIEYTERAISGVLGASTARSLVSAALDDRQLNLEEVVHFFDDTTQALQNQQSIMFSSLENLAQGISVVDADLRLVVWNKRYLDLFEYPDGMVQPGRPIADLIRYNAERGECGPGEVEDLVDKRLRYMQQGSAHRFIRRRSDGRVIEMVGNPLPNGGFVTSFTDVTEHIETQQALEDANIDLEARIESRARQVREVNRELTEEIERRRDTEEELKRAKAEAEAANASKTRFLALASHDILQPLNAARLYIEAIDHEQLDAKNNQLLGKVDNALDSTEHLLSTLLSIAKMEQGALQPKLKHVDLAQVLTPLVQEYAVLAQQRKLDFRAYIRSGVVVHTDPTYLRRIVQNFLSNAIKYTEHGRVVLGVRLHGRLVEISVWDTGPGIPEQQHERIFEAFIRYHKGSTSGVGLGLSVAQRMATQLNSPISIRSSLGKGSCFSVRVPMGEAVHVVRQKPQQVSRTQTQTMHFLCVDDDPENLNALRALLEKWGSTCSCFTRASEALEYAQAHPKPDGVLLDYQLGHGSDGLTLAAQLQQLWQAPLQGALVTAVREAEVKKQARKLGLQFVAKPVKPAQLKALLQHVQRANRR